MYRNCKTLDDTGMALFVNDNTNALRVVTEYINGQGSVNGANFST